MLRCVNGCTWFYLVLECRWSYTEWLFVPVSTWYIECRCWLRVVGLILASTSLEVRFGPLRFEGVREWDSVSRLGIEYSTIGR